MIQVCEDTIVLVINTGVLSKTLFKELGVFATGTFVLLKAWQTSRSMGQRMPLAERGRTFFVVKTSDDTNFYMSIFSHNIRTYCSVEYLYGLFNRINC